MQIKNTAKSLHIQKDDNNKKDRQYQIPVYM